LTPSLPPTCLPAHAPACLHMHLPALPLPVPTPNPLPALPLPACVTSACPHTHFPPGGLLSHSLRDGLLNDSISCLPCPQSEAGVKYINPSLSHPPAYKPTCLQTHLPTLPPACLRDYPCICLPPPTHTHTLPACQPTQPHCLFTHPFDCLVVYRLTHPLPDGLLNDSISCLPGCRVRQM
jgi:hypothetical protein